MRTTRTAPRGLLTAMALLAVAACQDDRTPLGPEETRPATAETLSTEEGGDLAADQIERPHEDEFVSISADVPSFGGYFYQDGVRVIYVTDLADAEAAVKAVESSASLDQSEPSHHEEAYFTGENKVVQVQFRFLDLRAWRNEILFPVMDIQGLENLDLDEAGNVISAGISSPEAEEELRARLDEHGIPQEAVVTEQTAPAEGDLTLRDRYRPLQGGFQIQNANNGICTLGFNAYWNGGRAWLTNSHCTGQYWKTDGIAFYQNLVTGGNYVGSESYDRGPWRCGFFWLYQCRYSDAAVVGTPSDVAADFPYIARTRFWAYGPTGVGSIDVDPYNPRMRVVAKRPAPRVGDYLDKMGRTTGWTFGRVQRTCQDIRIGGGWVLCQDRANYGRAGGDSGSPVFMWHGDRVTLYGLHWGAQPLNGTTTAIFSAMWNIERDLGALVVH